MNDDCTWETLSDCAGEYADAEKVEDAKALADESCAVKDSDDFDADYVDEVLPKYEDVIKPEHHSKIRDFFKRELDLLDNPKFHDPVDED
jgi:hypothetical protein